MKFGRTLRGLMNAPKMIVAPGVYDGLSVLLAKRAKFPVIYMRVVAQLPAVRDILTLGFTFGFVNRKMIIENYCRNSLHFK